MWCGYAVRGIRRFYSLNEDQQREKFVQYNRVALVEPARRHGFASNNGVTLGDLEILAKLQHLGAATCLLDFTRNALVGLWMACNAENANERSQNGRVFAVNLTDKDKFRALAPADARGDDNLGQVLWNPSEGTRSTLS